MEYPPVVIAPSAHKHGVEGDQITHAIRNAIRSFDLDENMTMLIGADQSGTLLEVGVVASEDGPIVAVHAMPARSRFL
jgi:hypothetical protein